jgi:hypothetical protein
VGRCGPRHRYQGIRNQVRVNHLSQFRPRRVGAEWVIRVVRPGRSCVSPESSAAGYQYGTRASLFLPRSLVLAALLVATVVSMVALAPSQRDAIRRHCHRRRDVDDLRQRERRPEPRIVGPWSLVVCG